MKLKIILIFLLVMSLVYFGKIQVPIYGFVNDFLNRDVIPISERHKTESLSERYKTTTTIKIDDPCDLIYETLGEGYGRARIGNDWCYKDKGNTTILCLPFKNKNKC